jgi:hypothetical protein
MALRRVGEGFETTVARPPGCSRPWAHTPPPSAALSGAARQAPGNPAEDELPAEDEPERSD